MRSLFTGVMCNSMDFLFALVSWQLWKERNAHCFREASSSLADLLQIIKAEADNWIQAGAMALQELARG